MLSHKWYSAVAWIARSHEKIAEHSTPRHVWTSLSSIILLLSAAACSDIVPGMNVRLDGSNHSYSVVQDDSPSAYKVVDATPESDFQVVPVTADVLRSVLVSQEAELTQSSAENLPSLLPSSIPEEYRLGPGDIIYITVWEHPELTSPVQTAVNDTSVQAVQGRLVGTDGSIFYPYVGKFKAAGMTIDEMREYLTKKLEKVITNPQLDVRVVAFRADRVEVTGEVLKPGTINLDDTPKGVLQAIALSGGLTPFASRRRAVLLRDGQSHVIDMAGLLSGNRPVPNPALKSGDVLHIPDQTGDEAFVLGAVIKQQPIQIEQDSMPLIRALTDAGGLDPLRGNQNGVLVFRLQRTEDKVHATVYTLDLSHPDGVLLATQFPLHPHDVVYVQATALSQYNSVILELLPTVTTIFDAAELNYLSRH